ncbi:hypothetical protein ACQ4PT_008253 [Festuca glaucescens]
MAAPQPRLALARDSSAPSAAAVKASASPTAAEAPPNAAPVAPRISCLTAMVSPRLTRSSCTPEMEEGRHLFDVNRYGLLKDLGVGKFVNSGTFDVGGYSWALRFYPAGSEAASAGQHHVSLYLQLMTPNVEVRALFDLKLMDQSNGRWDSLFGDGGKTSRGDTFPTKLSPHHPPRCWGVPLWKAGNLETSVYIHNDWTVQFGL